VTMRENDRSCHSARSPILLKIFLAIFSPRNIVIACAFVIRVRNPTTIHTYALKISTRRRHVMNANNISYLLFCKIRSQISTEVANLRSVLVFRAPNFPIRSFSFDISLKTHHNRTINNAIYDL